MSIPFIGKRFSLAEFEAYLETINFSRFKPVGVTIHHTWNPNLRNRPNGLEDSHLQNLKTFYENKGWRGGPHIFIDDQYKGIIVFQRLDRRGTHAISFNRNTWGLEMLGNFDSSSEFKSVRGQKIYNLTIATTQLLLAKLGAFPAGINEAVKFHRDDPLTSKSCPGKQVSKTDFLNQLKELAQIESSSGITITVEGQPNKVFSNVEIIDSRAVVPVRQFLGYFNLSSKYSLEFKKGTSLTSSTLKIKPLTGPAIDLKIVDFTEKGLAQVNLVSLAKILNLKITWYPNLKKITLTAN